MPHAILKKIISIEPANEFINYISNRLQMVDYRGIHISQHNRYDFEYIIKLIKIIYQVSNNQLFEIPAGDYSDRTGKKDYNINYYPQYKQIVDGIYSLTKKGSYNSVKKNFFVDLERMGLLKRIDKKQYAKLTNNALYLIDLYDKGQIRMLAKHFTDLLDEKLFGNFLSDLVEFMWIYGYFEIDILEYTFVVNDIEITNTYKDILLRSYRTLTSIQKDNILKLIKEYANPKNFSGDKTQKKDFHNWINESQQIFSLIKFTTYFQVIEKSGLLKLLLNTNNDIGIFTVEEIKRSQKIRTEYFQLHHINKHRNFELHHIVPVKVALNKKDMKNIDNVLNLIYIDESGHKQIHKTRTYGIKYIDSEYISLVNIKDNLITNKFTNNNQILVKQDNSLLKKIQNYNIELVDAYKEQILLNS